jgi:hypothetical protein
VGEFAVADDEDVDLEKRLSRKMFSLQRTWHADGVRLEAV